MTDRATIETAIWTQLGQVQDPCSVRLGRPMSLVTMGLVDAVCLRGGAVDVRLVLTDASCVFFFSFADEIEQRLRAVDGVDTVTVHVDTDQLWTPDRIAADFQTRPGRPEKPSLNAEPSARAVASDS